MNPLRLRVENFRSYGSIDLTFPEGCVAITGPNGSGKSSVIAALDVALFGSRNMGDFLSDDADGESMFVELEFEHSGETYRVRRSFSAKGRGRSTTDFERMTLTNPGDGVSRTLSLDWEPLTRETQAATQEAIEEVLGLSRETLRASALLMQGEGGVWTEAKPAERKAVLSEILGLATWDRFLEAARADRRAADRSLAETDGRIALLEERGGDVAALAEAKLRAEEVVGDRERKHAAADNSFGHAEECVRVIERSEAEYSTRKAALVAADARHREKRAIVDLAEQAREEITDLDAQIARSAAPDVAALERRAQELQQQVSACDAAEAERDRLFAEAGKLFEEVDRIAEHELPPLRERVRQAELVAARLNDPSQQPTCQTCGQHVHGEALSKALAEARAKRDEAADQIVALEARAEALQSEGMPLRERAMKYEMPARPSPDEVTAVTAQIAEARRIETEIAGLRGRRAKLVETATLPDGIEREIKILRTAFMDAKTALAVIDEPEPGALDAAKVAAVTAKAQLDIASRSLTEARENLIRAQSALEQSQAAAHELAAARIRRDELADEIEILTTLERAYGRDGIPALIVEASAIPSIEAEASRILSELDTSYRVELRTQRELKSSDGLADTLDVVVIAEAGARPYETFSGGERTRLNSALRISLASLLAHRRGAESKVLVFDEPEFLDQAGQLALAAVLQRLVNDGTFEKVICVSHADALRDVFDSALIVTKEDGRSRVEVAA